MRLTMTPDEEDLSYDAGEVAMYKVMAVTIVTKYSTTVQKYSVTMAVTNYLCPDFANTFRKLRKMAVAPPKPPRPRETDTAVSAMDILTQMLPFMAERPEEIINYFRLEHARDMAANGPQTPQSRRTLNDIRARSSHEPLYVI
jgi:hypothetical protein